MEMCTKVIIHLAVKNESSYVPIAKYGINMFKEIREIEDLPIFYTSGLKELISIRSGYERLPNFDEVMENLNENCELAIVYKFIRYNSSHNISEEELKDGELLESSIYLVEVENEDDLVLFSSVFRAPDVKSILKFKTGKLEKIEEIPTNVGISSLLIEV